VGWEVSAVGVGDMAGASRGREYLLRMRQQARPVCQEIWNVRVGKVARVAGETPDSACGFANRATLGVKAVMKFSALLVDGAVELEDGRRLAVEIKFRMNWGKACVAEYEFRNFLKRTERRPFPVDGGLVFFEQFSGDWCRCPARRRLE
jgi:hypothetical protein